MPVRSTLAALVALLTLGFAPAGLHGVRIGPAPHGAQSTAGMPAIWPRPQSVTARPGQVTVPATVRLVSSADAASVRVVTSALNRAGARHIVPSGPAQLIVYLGGAAAKQALQRLHVQGPDGLRSGGYAIGIGSPQHQATIALAGADSDGDFYAAQTLRQLAVGRRIAAIAVRDWPGVALRGVIEGFYGAPWSSADRLSQLDFLGRTKQNIYVYSPKDDPYLRAQWPDPYPADRLAVLQILVSRALADHVRFTYALSPGLSVCYSSAADEKALIAKFQSLYDIGVRSFAIPLDDISYTSWNCAADEQKFGTGGAAAGSAQSYLLNRIQRDFIATHPDVAALQMVPTEYSDVDDSPYKQALRQQLDARVVVEWTGVGVVAPQISAAQAAAARAVFGHDVLVWDNYPVNDFQTDRLFLGPYIGREPGISGHVLGVTANPMVQSEPSKIAEFTTGAFLWNPAGYDPDVAWSAAIRELGAGAWPALRILAENSYSTRIQRIGSDRPDAESPVLQGLISRYEAHPGQDAALLRYFRAMVAAPAHLRSGAGALAREVGPWLQELASYGRAGEHALAMLRAQRQGAAQLAWSERRLLVRSLAAAAAVTVQTANGPERPALAQGVFDAFARKALERNNAWLGLAVDRGSASTTLGTYGSFGTQNMVDGDDSSYFYSDRPPTPGDSVEVDLGRERPLRSVRIAMSKSDSPDDYFHSATLEYSSDGSSWTGLGSFADQATIAANTNVQARYVRLRATADQAYWIVVREFTVLTAENPQRTVTGSPAAPGSEPAMAADTDPDTAYTASGSEGSLTVTLAPARSTDRIGILQDPARPVRLRIDVRQAGSWQPVGTTQQGFADLIDGHVPLEAIRLSWNGSHPPAVYEVVPHYPRSTMAWTCTRSLPRCRLT